MTIEPISDERLAEIRAGYERIARRLFIAANMMASNPLFPRGEARDEIKDDLRDAAHLVRALLSRLDKAEAGWQPIETAPKDGTIVDLWARVFGPVSRDNDEARVYVEFRVPAARLAAGGWTNEDGNSLDLEGWDGLVFTHWRPLPPPPSES